MATAALRRRDAAAAKLKDSTRQLRRYLDGDSHVERILIQKCDKVDVDREELVAKHIEYAERAEIPLNDHDMTTFIEAKIDHAVDLVDEATLKAQELRANLDDAAARAVDERKQLEETTTKLHSESCQRLVEEILHEIITITDKDEPTTTDVKSALSELDKAEEQLNKSWKDRQMMIRDA